MATKKAYIACVALIKANYRLSDLPDETVEAWWLTLEDESLSDKMLLKATKRILKTHSNWFKEGMGFPALILEQVEIIREKRRQWLLNNPPKPPAKLPPSDEEIEENRIAREKFSAFTETLRLRTKMERGR